MSFGDGESMSYRGLEQRIAAVRAHLHRAGIAPGDRVALMMKNSLFYPVAWLGIVTGGAVAVPVNSRLGEVDARYILERSGAVAAFIDETTDVVARAAAPDRLRHLWTSQIDRGAPAPEPRVHAGTLANIQYTSGTTGWPKGCLLTHRYWQRMGAAAAQVMELTGRDTLLTSQPHSYIDPQWNVIAALRAGAHLVLLDSFHPSTFMREVARFGVTVFYCLGVMPTLLLKQPPAAEDGANALTRVYCSAIPVEHHATLENRWGAPWSEAFGMTETGLNTAVLPSEHDRCVGTQSIGRALPHNEAAIVDEADRELSPGEVGELVFRGLGFMEGYHGDPEATALFWRNGWAHTGDLASRDEEGFIYYRGRRKEMVRRGGENIAPVEIETALSAHPGVLECAVASVPDPDLGEEIKAYVVPRADMEPSAHELAAYLRQRLAPFKVPRYWEFRTHLPHTPSEKVAKPELERDKAYWAERTIDLKD